MTTNGIHAQPTVAIIGGGIAGIALGLGLLARSIPVTIYERAQSCREIGAGIGFTPNAERAMTALDPRIYRAFKAVATQNGDDWFRWIDGYHHDRSKPDDTHEELLFQLYLGERGFEGCQRSGFIEEMLKHVPEGVVQYNRNLVSMDDSDGNAKVALTFRDDSVEEADVVIGCDGIRSRVRQLLLGDSHPASYPTYSHKYALRGLIPMDKAKAALGEEKTATRFMHLGPNAHALTFPVAMGKLLNVVAFVTDPGEWPHKDRLSAPAEKATAVKAFSDFGPAIRAIMSLLPDELDAWAVFDTFDHPAPSYVKGRVCVSGDAAHASAPHHGAGAGFCIEDAAVLAGVLGEVTTADSDKSMADKVRAALLTYNFVRYERSQWLVRSSRVIGEVFEWQYPETGSDPTKCGKETEWRSHRIWDYDVDAMMRQTRDVFAATLAV